MKEESFYNYEKHVTNIYNDQVCTSKCQLSGKKYGGTRTGQDIIFQISRK